MGVFTISAQLRAGVAMGGGKRARAEACVTSHDVFVEPGAYNYPPKVIGRLG